MSLDISLNKLKVTEIFSANFTHNVTPMWREAGIYDALYNSEHCLARRVLPALKAGLADMEANPEKYKALDSENGWGTYEHALPWLQKLVEAFEENPEASIEVSK